jgi:DNA repair exonuclease SbcCD ATPase subunit
MGFELLLPFFGSLIVFFLFRRADGNNFRIGQLKKYSQKLQEDLEAVTISGVQTVKDATIDLELTNKQAKKLVVELQSRTNETSLMLDSLKAHKDYLDTVLVDLKEVVKLSNEIREESHYVQEGMEIIQGQRERIREVDGEIQQVRNQVKEITLQFNDKLNSRTSDILESLASKIVELENLLEVKSDSLDLSIKKISQDYKSKLSEEIESIVAETVERVELANVKMDDFNSFVRDGEKSLEMRLTRYRDSTDSINERIERLDAKLEEKAESVGEAVQTRLYTFEKKFQEKFESIFDQLAQNKDAFLSGVKMEIDMIRTDVESMNLETMTRKDEILTEARRQSEIVLNQINNFHEKFLDAENRILKTAELKKADLLKDILRFENNFRQTSESFYSEADVIKDSILKNLHNFESDLDKATSIVVSNTRDKFNALRNELEESMISLHGRKKGEFLDELSAIDLKINELSRETSNKIKNVDDHFYDLKSALLDTSREILSQVEKEVERLSLDLDTEKNRVDQKFEFYTEGWNLELDRIKSRTNKDIDSLVQRLKDIHIEGKDLADSIRNEFTNGRSMLDIIVKKADENLRAEIDSLTGEVASKVKKSTEEVEALLNRLQKAGINLYEKQESLLSDYGERLYRDLQTKLEKVRFESEELLEDIQKAGMNLLEKQEEKIDRLKTTIDERISRQLTVLLDKGQLQLDQLETRISTYLLEVRQNLEKNLKDSKDDSERQITNFNSQMQKSLREMEKVNREFLDTNREEFIRSRDELSKIHISIEEEMERVSRMKGSILDEFSREESRIKNIIEKLSSRMEEVESYGEILKNAEITIKDSESTIDVMSDLLDRLRMEGSSIQEYTKHIDFLKTSKKEIELEMRTLDNQRIRIEQIENELNRANNVCDLINNRTEELHDKISMITSIDNKLVEMSRIQEEMEVKISEFKNVNEKINEINSVISTTNRSSTELYDKLQKLYKEIEKLELKESDLQQQLNFTEERATDIAARTVDFKSIESKFDKVENLMMDLSTKHKQVSTLSKRIETLKVDTDDMRENLEDLLQEAEDKFQKLSDFLHHVETFAESKKGIGITKSTPKETKAEQIKKKKATVLNLYENYAWTTDVIAEKLNMDKNLVEDIVRESVS